MTRRRKSKPESVMTEELRAILDAAAAMTSSGQEPRKHHIVPNFYLDRWAVEGRVKVTDLENNRYTHEQSPGKALRVTDYYRVAPHAVQGGSPVTWEVWLSTIEGHAAGVFKAVDERGLQSLDGEQWAGLLQFLAVQITRGRAYRYKARWALGPGYYQMWELGHPGAIEHHLRIRGEDPTPERIAEMQAYFDQAATDPWSVPALPESDMDMSTRAAPGLALALADRQFVIYKTAVPILTSDEPVTLLFEQMGADHPTGAGYAGAPIIVFPWGPREILAMFRKDMPILRAGDLPLTREESLDLNQVIAGNAHQYLVESPGRKLAENLFLPENKPPMRLETLKSEGGKEIVHWMVQNRWTGEPTAPSRPVPAWWPQFVPVAPKPTEADYERDRQLYYDE